MKALAIKIIKDVIIEALCNPEKIVKFLLVGILLPILLLVLLIALPIILIMSVPLLLLNCFSSSSDDDLTKQLDTIAIYQEAPEETNKDCLKWIEDMKDEYSYADSIDVIYEFNVTWQDLMAIDTVLVEQDFKKSKKKDIINLANKFIYKNTYTEIYQVEEEIEVEQEIEVTDPETGEVKTKTITVTETILVDKIRAVIELKTKPFIDVLNELNFDGEQIDMATRVLSNILGYDSLGNINFYDDIDLSDLQEYSPGYASIPYYNQTDKRWALSSYGSGTIYEEGCGPTSLAMVISGLCSRSDITPVTIADWSQENGYHAEGQGSYWSLMQAGGEAFGLNVKSVSRKDPKKIIQALSDGYPVIAIMGRGHFTQYGHFIVLRGITDDGKILVYDPYSYKRSQQEWDLGIILSESSTKGGVNGNPFWIYKP